MKKSNLRIVVSLLLLLSAASPTKADIYEWAYVNSSDPSQGVKPSSMLCPGGGGVSAVPGADLYSVNLTQAYLLGANLSSGTLTNVNLKRATVAGVYFRGSNLTASQLYSTANYKAQSLQAAVGFPQTGIRRASQSFYPSPVRSPQEVICCIMSPVKPCRS